jgi:hypothetical protein
VCSPPDSREHAIEIPSLTNSEPGAFPGSQPKQRKDDGPVDPFAEASRRLQGLSAGAKKPVEGVHARGDTPCLDPSDRRLGEANTVRQLALS